MAKATLALHAIKDDGCRSVIGWGWSIEDNVCYIKSKRINYKTKSIARESLRRVTEHYGISVDRIDESVIEKQC